jgi:hypothetical protein
MYQSPTDIFRSRPTTYKTQCLRTLPHLNPSTCRWRSPRSIINHAPFPPGQNPRHLQRHGARIPQRPQATENPRRTTNRAACTMVRECIVPSRSLSSAEMVGDWTGECGSELDWEGIGDGKGLGIEFCGRIGWGFGNACIGYFDKGSRS